MRIDCHTHAFADKIADKAVSFMSEYYQISVPHQGRINELIKLSEEAHLDAAILLVAATNAEQVNPANNWMLNLKQTQTDSQTVRLIKFGAYHVDDQNWLTEINRLREYKIPGIKIHPEFQQIDLADDRLLPFFEEVQKDFILMIHVGDPEPSPNNYSTPAKIRRIMTLFPHLRIIAAHMGGYKYWEESLDILAGHNLYLDTSSALAFMPDSLIKKIVNKHGTDKLLVGSDYPVITPAKGIELVQQKMDWLTSNDIDNILGNNCAQLLGIA